MVVEHFHKECGGIYENIKTIILLLNKKDLYDIDIDDFEIIEILGDFFSNDNLTKCKLLQNILESDGLIKIIKYMGSDIRLIHIYNNYSIYIDFLLENIPKSIEYIKLNILFGLNTRMEI